MNRGNVPRYVIRTKFRHKILYLMVILVLVVFWIMTSQPKNSARKKTISNEEILHERVVQRMALIKQWYCNQGNSKVIRHDLDLNSFIRPNFLPNFKNPCFIRNQTKGSTVKVVFGCLPYFIIAGFPKAGTTDIWTRLANHPDVVLHHVKEPFFFNKGKMSKSFVDGVQSYIKFFDKAALKIQTQICPYECGVQQPFYPAITGEGSVDTAHDNREWEQLPGNQGCSEPVVTNADFVHHLNPNMKVIFSLRNPADRLYSDYIYEARFFGYKTSPEDFHLTVQAGIHNFTQCMLNHTVRSCVYNISLDSDKLRLRVGIYHVFIEDWLAVFSPRNIFVVQAEETLTNKKFQVYRQLLGFLQLRPFTRQEEMNIFTRGPMNTRSKPEKDVGDMLPETRKLLYEFYEPSNNALKQLLPGVDYNHDNFIYK